MYLFPNPIYKAHPALVYIFSLVLMTLLSLSLPSKAQEVNPPQEISIERIRLTADSIRKGTLKTPSLKNIDIAKGDQWKPIDATPSIQRVEEQSSFDEGRFAYQDRDKYIAERKKEYMVEKGMFIGMGILIIAFIVYFLTGGLGKTLTKIR